VSEVERRLADGKEEAAGAIVRYRTTFLAKKKTIPVHYKHFVTFCYACLGHCHGACTSKEVYHDGTLDLSQCEAFQNNPYFCDQCQHSVDEHAHTTTAARETVEQVALQEPYIIPAPIAKEAAQLAGENPPTKNESIARVERDNVRRLRA